MRFASAALINLLITRQSLQVSIPEGEFLLAEFTVLFRSHLRSQNKKAAMKPIITA
jgi:hypothetical protein